MPTLKLLAMWVKVSPVSPEVKTEMRVARSESYTPHVWLWKETTRLNCNCWLGKLLRRKLGHLQPSFLGMSQISPGIITRWSKGLLRRHLNTVNAQLELSSTIDAAFDEIIASMSSSAQDHINLADTLTAQTIEILKILEKKNEEVKKKACPRSPY